MGAPFFGPQAQGSFGDFTFGAYQPEINKAAFTAWDKIFIGSTELTLVRSVRCHKAGKVDNKGSPASSGAQPSHLGYEPAEVELTLEMWTRDQQKAWESIIPALQPRHGKAPPKPVDVVFPSLAELGVRKLYPERIGALEPTGRNGLFRVQIWFTEFAPLVGVGVNTPKVSLTDLAGPQQPPSSPASNPTAVGPH